MSSLTFGSSLLAFLLFTLASCQTVENEKLKYYIDPSSDIAFETGEMNQPFKSLKSAILKFQQDLADSSKDTSINAFFYCKADQVISDFDMDTMVWVNSTIDAQSFLQFTSYTKDNKNLKNQKQATLLFSQPFSHFVFLINNTKVLIENINFQFVWRTDSNLTENILFEGSNSEVIISNCQFRPSDITSNDTSQAVMKVKIERFSITYSLFAYLKLNIPLIDIDAVSASVIKFENNQFKNVYTDSEPAFRAKNLTSWSFISNLIEETNGPFVSISNALNAFIDKNSFHNFKGHFPLQIRDVENVLLTENSFFFGKKSNLTYQGLLFFLDIPYLTIDGIRLEEYLSDTSAVSIAFDEIHSISFDPKIHLKNLKFIQNSLIFNNSEEGLALLRIDLSKKAEIIIEKALFLENTIISRRATSKPRGSSTIWINSKDSTLNLINYVLESNNADPDLANFHAFVESLTVTKSSFIDNNRQYLLDTLLGENPITVPNSIINMDIYAKTINFLSSEFIDNYASAGGGLKLMEIPEVLTSNSVIIRDCVFLGNQAEIGGAIFNNITSDDTKVIIFEDTYFGRNNATQFPDYNPNPLISVTSSYKPHQSGSRIILKAKSKTDLTTERYTSGAFVAKNVISGQPIDYSLEFYISSVHEHVPYSRKVYLTSVQILEEEGTLNKQVIFQGFNNMETFYYFEIPSLVIRAPPSSLNMVLVTMKPLYRTHEDEPSEYSFVFYLQMAKTTSPCQRGEIFINQTNQCEICPPGTFSLVEDSKECLACPQGGDCSLGGANLYVKPGFWRDSTNPFYEEIYKCFSKERCSGGPHSQCVQGYTGPLCGICDTKGDEKYRNTLKGICKSCKITSIKELTWDISLFMIPLAILGFSTFIIAQSTTSFGFGEESSAKRLRFCLLLNLLISYMQNLFIIDTFGISLPESFRYFIYVFGNPSHSSFSYLACYFQDILTANVDVILIYSLIPFVKALILLPFLRVISNQGFFKQTVTIFFIWLLYLESYGFIDFLFTISSCKQVGAISYSKYFVSTICDSVTFDHFKQNIILPSFVLFFVLIIALTLYIIKSNFQDTGIQRRMEMITFAKGDDFISQGKWAWIYFYFDLLGKFSLIALSNSREIDTSLLSFVMVYYILLLVFNSTSKILFLKGWKTYLLIIDKVLILSTFIVGVGLKYIEDGFFKSFSSQMLANLNLLYIGLLILLMFENHYKSIGSFKTVLRIKSRARQNTKRVPLIQHDDKIIQEVDEEYEEDGTSFGGSLHEENASVGGRMKIRHEAN